MTNAVTAPGPLWPGHKPATLFVVVQQPKGKWRKGLVSFLLFVSADSKAAAVRAYNERLGVLMPERKYYNAPYAEPVTIGKELRV